MNIPSDQKKPYWHPERFQTIRPFLEKRSAIMAEIRRFFTAESFVEVDTPALQLCPGMEVHLRAFKAPFASLYADEPEVPFFLHTSPEFAMKKLMTAGMEKIFQLSHVYRNGEVSRTHLPEFTMLEWYRTGTDYRTLMADTEELVQACAHRVGCSVVEREDKSCDVTQPFERLSVNEAFLRYAGFDMLACIDDPNSHDPAPEAIRAAAKKVGVSISQGDRFEDVFFKIMFEKIEPYLGYGRGTILYDYPLCMAALSRRKESDPRVSERFEAYVMGVELANAFSELTDPVEQRARFEEDAALKRSLYGDDDAWPVDEDFLAALEYGMPESAGIALGVDRLIMLLAGAPDLASVQWGDFPCR